MTANVEIINNPYAHKMKILINGNPPSAFSMLDKFLDEPFLYWCDRIFPEIQRELNGGSFTVFFESRQEEIAVLEKIAGRYPGCTQFSSRPCLRSTPLTERMSALSRLFKNRNISAFRYISRSALFILTDSEKQLQIEISDLSIENRYCKIQCSYTEYSEYCKHPKAADVVFLVGAPEDKEKLAKLETGGSRFMLLVGKRTGFEEMLGGTPVFQSTSEEFFDSVFNCFILGPLAEMFRECIATLPESVHRQLEKELELIQSTSLRVLAKAESGTIECGNSVSLTFESDMPGYKIDTRDLEFGYSEKGIIRCSGIRVEGLKAGKSTLYVYQKGEKDPCTSIDFQVIQRNRVTQLTIEDQNVILGEGDRQSLAWGFNPPDADNLSKIQWSSDDPSVLTVDQTGNIKAGKTGNTYIRLMCENVSTKTLIHVLPYMQDIQVECDTLTLCPSMAVEVPVHTVPEVTIEGGFTMGILDARIANAVNGKVTGFAVGSTTLVVQDKTGRLRKEIPVHVVSEKAYRKMNKNSGEKKRGLLASLFG